VRAGLVDGDLVVDAPVLVVEVSGLDASIALPEVFFGVVVVFGFCVFLCVDLFPDAASEEVAWDLTRWLMRWMWLSRVSLSNSYWMRCWPWALGLGGDLVTVVDVVFFG
jgi:hypothetical protein